MRRALCAAVAALAVLAVPAASPLVVGIGEQKPGIFASKPW